MVIRNDVMNLVQHSHSVLCNPVKVWLTCDVAMLVELQQDMDINYWFGFDMEEFLVKEMKNGQT